MGPQNRDELLVSPVDMDVCLSTFVNKNIHSLLNEHCYSTFWHPCLRKFLRFRMGCHGLPKETQAHGPVYLVLTGHCPLCGPGSYGDEKHLVFECPYVQPLRVQYATLFPRPTMVQFLWQDDLLTVAKFVCDALDIMLGADSPDEGQASDQP